MADCRVFPSTLRGELRIPSSKSQTLRAILFASLAKGTSYIHDYLSSPDTFSMIEAVRLLGAQVEIGESCLKVQGVSGRFCPAHDVIQCGNSGIILRFIGALAGHIPHYTILTGDASIRTKRPVKPLIDGLQQLGVVAESANGTGRPPLLIRGPMTQSSATIEGQDSQPVSGLLIAAAFASHPIALHVQHPGEKPWVDLTLHWFDRLGISYERQGHSFYQLQGGARFEGFHYEVPGDLSTAAFPVVAALITQSELLLHHIDMNDSQGDKAVFSVLEKMGARLTFNPDQKTLRVEKGPKLQGIRIDVNNFIDSLPILAVAACYAEGKTEIVNGAIARVKESDRIQAIASELKKMGGHIEEREDGLIIHPTPLRGAEVDSHQDHRIAMSLIVAGLAGISPALVRGVESIAKTYPSCIEGFQSVLARIE